MMKALPTIYNELKKISTFLYILIFLFVVLIIFNINFRWEGLSLIIRVYIFIFSFYLIFNLSSIKTGPLKDEFSRKYGKAGPFLLFINARVLPFLFIYLLSCIFTLIDYIGKSNWPQNPVLDLMNGRYSNTVIYSLFLLIVLKLKKGPGITIPLFLVISTVYFSIDKTVYTLYESGMVISCFKYLKYILFTAVLLFEFFPEKRKLPWSVFISVLAGSAAYFAVFGIYYGIITFSGPGNYSFMKSSYIIMRMGYSCPYEEFRSAVVEKKRYDYITELIYYSRHLKKEINFSREQWDVIFRNISSRGSIETVSSYLYRNDIFLSFETLAKKIRVLSGSQGADINAMKWTMRYLATYCTSGYEEFVRFFHQGNTTIKIFLMKTMAVSGCSTYVPLLLDQLTSFEQHLPGEAYRALVNITGIDPAGGNGLKYNSPEVIDAFRKKVPLQGTGH